MLFRAGSIYKMLTAAVLVGLADEGKIALDAPLEESVPGLAPRLSRLTADQLLSHTAGLIDPARICCAQDERALAAQVRAYRDEDYFFTDPGRIFSYSNTGYIIAGFLIEQLSGELYADAMQHRLFGPLGMRHTTFRPTIAMTFPLSQGHDGEGRAAPTVVRPFVNNVGDWPAGFAYTNVGDLSRFAIALMNRGKIDGKQVLAPRLLESFPNRGWRCLLIGTYRKVFWKVRNMGMVFSCRNTVDCASCTTAARSLVLGLSSFWSRRNVSRSSSWRTGPARSWARQWRGRWSYSCRLQPEAARSGRQCVDQRRDGRDRRHLS